MSEDERKVIDPIFTDKIANCQKSFQYGSVIHDFKDIGTF